MRAAGLPERHTLGWRPIRRATREWSWMFVLVSAGIEVNRISHSGSALLPITPIDL